MKVLPVDIQRSAARCTVEAGSIRLGFNYVHGLGDSGACQIETARHEGDFLDLADFCKRVALPRKRIEKLILIGAMDGWGIARRQMLWQLNEVAPDDNPLGLVFAGSVVDLPPLTHAETVYLEYKLLGLSPGEHVMALYRSLLDERGILGSSAFMEQPDGATVRIAGQVVMHRAPPTAKGHHFLALEDESAMINVIVRPAIYAEYSAVIRESPLLVVEGTVQKRGNVMNLLARQVVAMPI